MLTELPFHYQIRRSLKVSRARIVVKPGQVEIVAPWEVPEHKLHKFVHAKQAWVTQALKKMAGSNPGQHKFAPNRCISGELLTYRGQQYEITLQPASSSASKSSSMKASRFIYQKACKPKMLKQKLKSLLSVG